MRLTGQQFERAFAASFKLSASSVVLGIEK